MWVCAFFTSDQQLFERSAYSLAMGIQPIYNAFASRPKDQAFKKPMVGLHTVSPTSNFHCKQTNVSNSANNTADDSRSVQYHDLALNRRHYPSNRIRPPPLPQHRHHPTSAPSPRLQTRLYSMRPLRPRTQPAHEGRLTRPHDPRLPG